jgi:hypothetical protein
MTELERAMLWLGGRDTGSSSKSIMRHMLGAPSGEMDYPIDPADLGRCLRLLAEIPEWRPRIGEMATRGAVWALYAARWRGLEASMDAEVGIDWSKGRSAPLTHDLMNSLEAEAIQASPDYYDVKINDRGHLTTWSRKTGGRSIRI